MPGWVIFLIELFFNESSDIFFDVEFFQGLVGAINGVLLHFFGHVSIFDDGFSVGHEEEWDRFFGGFLKRKFKL